MLLFQQPLSIGFFSLRLFHDLLFVCADLDDLGLAFIFHGLHLHLDAFSVFIFLYLFLLLLDKRSFFVAIPLF
jgi:hypothetical protein